MRVQAMTPADVAKQYFQDYEQRKLLRRASEDRGPRSVRNSMDAADAGSVERHHPANAPNHSYTPTLSHTQTHSHSAGIQKLRTSLSSQIHELSAGGGSRSSHNSLNPRSLDLSQLGSQNIRKSLSSHSRELRAPGRHTISDLGGSHSERDHGPSHHGPSNLGPPLSATLDELVLHVDKSGLQRDISWLHKDKSGLTRDVSIRLDSERSSEPMSPNRDPLGDEWDELQSAEVRAVVSCCPAPPDNNLRSSASDQHRDRSRGRVDADSGGSIGSPRGSRRISSGRMCKSMQDREGQEDRDDRGRGGGARGGAPTEAAVLSAVQRAFNSEPGSRGRRSRPRSFDMQGYRHVPSSSIGGSVLLDSVKELECPPSRHRHSMDYAQLQHKESSSSSITLIESSRVSAEYSAGSKSGNPKQVYSRLSHQPHVQTSRAGGGWDESSSLLMNNQVSNQVAARGSHAAAAAGESLREGGAWKVLPAREMYGDTMKKERPTFSSSIVQGDVRPSSTVLWGKAEQQVMMKTGKPVDGVLAFLQGTWVRALLVVVLILALLALDAFK